MVGIVFGCCIEDGVEVARVEVCWETTHFGSLGKILFMHVGWVSCT